MAGGGSQHGQAGRRRAFHGMAAVLLLFAAIACSYLLRLEAHTRADIFLPTNYHAMLAADSAEDARQLNAYYQTYAQQEGRPYTIRQDLLLSRLAYIDAPRGFRGEMGGVTVGDLCAEVERTLADATVDAAAVFGRSREEIADITAGIGAYNHLRDLEIREYITDASGLAGYVLQNGDEITMTLRGTDDMVDNLDNVLLLPFNLSVQYAAVRELLQTYGDAQRIWLTGHSKGGHNAIYAASIDARCHATGFNAPGFGIFLSDAQHDGLDSGVNYVINGDVTGFLLFHLERRVVLESAAAPMPEGPSLNNRHRLDNFFAIDDLTVAAQIEPLGIWIEWVTQIAWLLLIFLAVYGAVRLATGLCHAIRSRRA